MSAQKSAARLLAKVCGLRSAEDLRAAQAANADLIGLVSYAPSCRHLEDAELAALGREMEASGCAARSVLVTVDRPRAEIDRVMAEGSLDAVQLCGSETPAEWRGAPYAVFRRVGVSHDAKREIEAWRSTAELFVLDQPGSPGGTGETVDVSLALELAAFAPCLFAGGVDAPMLESSLGRVLGESFVLGIDASSGLESARGVKDHASLQRYVDLVHGLRSSGPNSSSSAQDAATSR